MEITNVDLLKLMVQKMSKGTECLVHISGDDYSEVYKEIVDAFLYNTNPTNNIASLVITYYEHIEENIENGYYDDKSFSDFLNDLSKADEDLFVATHTLFYTSAFLGSQDYNDALEKNNGKDNLINKIMNPSYKLLDWFVIDSIKQMDYKDFLNTVYWKAIRQYKLDKANNKCALCNSKKRLNVHHKTYDRHGTEHLPEVADEDLIVLCQDCHAKFHDKLAS